jgi:hypothetical protein
MYQSTHRIWQPSTYNVPKLHVPNVYGLVLINIEDVVASDMAILLTWC